MKTEILFKSGIRLVFDNPSIFKDFTTYATSLGNQNLKFIVWDDFILAIDSVASITLIGGREKQA